MFAKRLSCFFPPAKADLKPNVDILAAADTWEMIIINQLNSNEIDAKNIFIFTSARSGVDVIYFQAFFCWRARNVSLLLISTVRVCALHFFSPALKFRKWIKWENLQFSFKVLPQVSFLTLLTFNRDYSSLKRSNWMLNKYFCKFKYVFQFIVDFSAALHNIYVT